jgi:hypothetical protein
MKNQMAEALAEDCKRYADNLQARSRDTSRVTTLGRLYSAIDRLHDMAASAAKDAERWLPIESAPRDGRRVLAYAPGLGACVVSAGWRNEKHDLVYWEAINGCVVEPTYWMSLPQPPAIDATS